VVNEQAPLACAVSTSDSSRNTPPKQPVAMLVLRFLLELVAFGAIGWAGWRIGDGGLSGGAIAGALTIAAMMLWGAPGVRGDPVRKPSPLIVVPGWTRVLIEMVVFGTAAWALWVFISRAASESFLTAVGIVYIVSWDRLWWLLRQR
jgi:hypothetical protein